MDLSLSPVHLEKQRNARSFCDEVLLPLEPVVTEHGHLPQQHRAPLRQAVVERGFTGINHAVEDGGCGYGIFAQTLINEQLGRATCGLWAAVWQPAAPLKFGTEEQKHDYLRPSCRGERRGCYAITEPGAGSDPRMVEARADLIDGTYRISG